MEKYGEPESFLNPDELASLAKPLTEEEEIADVLERGGPWITLTFTSNDGAFTQSRVLTLTEAEDLCHSLYEEVVQAKAKYNIEEVPDQPLPQENENEQREPST